MHETSLKDIWENSPQVKYLRGLRRKDIPKCLDCPDRGFCAVCMARNANENHEMSAIGTLGNPLRINEHYCRAAALNRIGFSRFLVYTQPYNLFWPTAVRRKQPSPCCNNMTMCTATAPLHRKRIDIQHIGKRQKYWIEIIYYKWFKIPNALVSVIIV